MAHPRKRPSPERPGAPKVRNDPSLLREVSLYLKTLTVRDRALIRAQSLIEETRDRFIELYDFAPNGYFVLDPNGVIRQCNLTAAAIVGKAKPSIEGLPLLGFVRADNRRALLDFLRRCRRANRSATEVELTVLTPNGERRVVLVCRPRSDGRRTPEYFTSVVDVTERTIHEHERARNSREYATLASRLIRIQDEERERIARNLHDDIGQQVTAVRLSLEEAMLSVPRRQQRTMHRVQSLVEQLDRRLHFVATELRPATLDLGIVAAIQNFVHEWSRTFKIPAGFHSAGIDAGLLGGEAETHIYRVMQEALHNVSKHAAATEVTVLLERRDGHAVLVVEDDGCGFDLTLAHAREGALGLLGMRERAQLVCGRLEMETTPGHGTSVFLYVPLRRQSP